MMKQDFLSLRELLQKKMTLIIFIVLFIQKNISGTRNIFVSNVIFSDGWT